MVAITLFGNSERVHAGRVWWVSYRRVSFWVTLCSVAVFLLAVGLAVRAADSGGFSAVSAGNDHTCGLRTDGTIICWGLNSHGQADAPPGSFTAVSAGTHSCGLRSNGSVVCWGLNNHGQADAPSGSFSAVSAGWGHSCGVRAEGSIVCWGTNEYGQSEAPAGSYTAVSTHFLRSCGLRTDGSVVCWGNPFDTGIPAGSFQAVSVGIAHACGLRVDGSVSCWGYDAVGTYMSPSGSFTEVSAGGFHWTGGHTCGLRVDGSVFCWGSGSVHGENVAPAGSFSAVSAGGWHSCALGTDGSVVCWGNNASGQLDVPMVDGAAADDAGVHQPAVDALRNEFEGIFDGTGCDGGLCPGDPLQRWEMAVWLVRALDRADPPSQATTRFDDVSNSLWWAPYADRLADLEVTSGCALAPLRYCPDRAVTRGQMATFLVRAFDLQAAAAAGFADTDGNTHQANIDALAAAGVTAGCKTDPLRYCPDRSVTRGQMATFLARALGLIE